MAQLRDTPRLEALLEAPMMVDPLRRHDCPPISDGAAAIMLAAGDAIDASKCQRPAFIRGFEHRVDHHSLGWRDLSCSPSAQQAGDAAGVSEAPVDVAELHAPFAHQEILLRRALRLGEDVEINPSGGALCANPLMVAGLIRMGEAAGHIVRGDATRTVGHATSGPCLQQNLVCVMEAAP